MTVSYWVWLPPVSGGSARSLSFRHVRHVSDIPGLLQPATGTACYGPSVGILPNVNNEFLNQDINSLCKSANETQPELLTSGLHLLALLTQDKHSVSGVRDLGF